MKPTDMMYAMARELAELKQRVETLEKQAVIQAQKPKRGRPPKKQPTPEWSNGE